MYWSPRHYTNTPKLPRTVKQKHILLYSARCSTSHWLSAPSPPSGSPPSTALWRPDYHFWFTSPSSPFNEKITSDRYIRRKQTHVFQSENQIETKMKCWLRRENQRDVEEHRPKTTSNGWKSFVSICFLIAQCSFFFISCKVIKQFFLQFWFGI